MRSEGRSSIGCGVLIVAFIALGAIASMFDQPAGGPGSTAGVEATATARRTPEPEPEPTAQPTTEPEPVAVALREALADGLVDMRAEGRNLQQLDIELTSNVAFTLEIGIEAGTLFVPGAANVQTMVVITDTHLVIEPELSVEWTLDVACGAMNKDTPTADNRFRLSESPAKADIRRLVALDAFADADFRVQQFAVWTITNNPTRRGYVGLGIGGVGGGPTNAEIREIRALFKAAGIDSSRYRAL